MLLKDLNLKLFPEIERGAERLPSDVFVLRRLSTPSPVLKFFFQHIMPSFIHSFHMKL